MKHLSYLFCCFIFLISCTKTNEIDLKNLNGYWEIDYVEISDESQKQGQQSKKEYNFNQNIDFFETKAKDNIGFRTKVKPGFNGIYTSTKQKLKYSILKKEGNYIVTYKTPTTTWSDELVEASAEKIVLKNTRGDLYFYKKFTPIIINEKK